MPLEEASWRMRSGPSADVERFHDGRAMSERIQEWLCTPEGSLANDPSWGHNLLRFKHSPISTSLEVQIEMSVARKMALDIDDLRLVAVNVEAKDIDLIYITVVHQYGTNTHQLTF